MAGRDREVGKERNGGAAVGEFEWRFIFSEGKRDGVGFSQERYNIQRSRSGKGVRVRIVVLAGVECVGVWMLMFEASWLKRLFVEG